VNGSLYDRLYLVWVKCHIIAADVLALTLFGVEALVGPSVSDSESLSNCLLLLYCWNGSLIWSCVS